MRHALAACEAVSLAHKLGVRVLRNERRKVCAMSGTIPLVVLTVASSEDVERVAFHTGAVMEAHPTPRVTVPVGGMVARFEVGA